MLGRRNKISENLWSKPLEILSFLFNSTKVDFTIIHDSIKKQSRCQHKYCNYSIRLPHTFITAAQAKDE